MHRDIAFVDHMGVYRVVTVDENDNIVTPEAETPETPAPVAETAAPILPRKRGRPRKIRG